MTETPQWFTITIIDNFNDKRIKSFPLSKAQQGVTIGRHRTNDILLSSLMISNFHCKIKLLTETSSPLIEVNDTSSNGTQYNGKDIGRGNSVKIDLKETIGISMSPNDFYNITFSHDHCTVETDIIINDIEDDLYKNYYILQRLGDGQYARVYKALNKQSNEIVALKILNQAKEKFQFDDMSKRELEIMKKVDHQNTVRFREIIDEFSHIIFEVDYCEGGDLFTRIVSTGKMDEREASFVFYQLRQDCLQQ